MKVEYGISGSKQCYKEEILEKRGNFLSLLQCMQSKPCLSGLSITVIWKPVNGYFGKQSEFLKQFIRDNTICQDKNNLKGKKYIHIITLVN